LHKLLAIFIAYLEELMKKNLKTAYEMLISRFHKFLSDSLTKLFFFEQSVSQNLCQHISSNTSIHSKQTQNLPNLEKVTLKIKSISLQQVLLLIAVRPR